MTTIGIGHDVTRYHRRAVTIVNAEQSGRVMLERLAELFDEDRSVNTHERTCRAARGVCSSFVLDNCAMNVYTVRRFLIASAINHGLFGDGARGLEATGSLAPSLLVNDVHRRGVGAWRRHSSRQNEERPLWPAYGCDRQC